MAVGRVPGASTVVVVHYNPFEVDALYVAECLLLEAFGAHVEG